MSADTPLAAGAVNIAPSPTVSQAKHTMTQRHTLSVSTPAKAAQPAPRIGHPLPWRGSLALVALLLSACASTPLPPWPGTPTAARSTTAESMPRVQRGVVVPAPLGQVRDNVVVTPLQVCAHASRTRKRCGCPLWPGRGRSVCRTVHPIQHTWARPRTARFHYQLRTGAMAAQHR